MNWRYHLFSIFFLSFWYLFFSPPFCVSIIHTCIDFKQKLEEKSMNSSLLPSLLSLSLLRVSHSLSHSILSLPLFRENVIFLAWNLSPWLSLSLSLTRSLLLNIRSLQVKWGKVIPNHDSSSSLFFLSLRLTLWVSLLHHSN